MQLHTSCCDPHMAIITVLAFSLSVCLSHSWRVDFKIYNLVWMSHVMQRAARDGGWGFGQGEMAPSRLPGLKLQSQATVVSIL